MEADPPPHGVKLARRNTVLSVRHWTDTLFSFTTTRDASFRFKNGQFTMIGVAVDQRPLLRAYSVASTNYDENLEFLSIKVPDGPLTSRLQNLRVGDPIIVGKKATGTLVLDNLNAGRRLFLLGTGTGLAPFLSLIRDPEVYERFETVVLVHGCRQVAELAYGERIQRELPADEFIGEMISRQLIYYPTVTREPFRNRGRITDLFLSAQFFSDIGQPTFDAAGDKFMLCGSPQMLADFKPIFSRYGLREGNHGEAGDYLIEKAFVEK
ncbi:ferredoxin--NADP reductase [Bosea sp. ASV33]|uniref:ferredoxin--NADP reductase n=1 Tax=Bosea sp. ASV33 TaxID=2795106 RepID=UPI001AEE7F91|nr:ferredoxin--NADP reductase [Bosea sp. ASV33]